ncbi:MAG: NDP-hexose 2,3-dehydratase family protein [Gammaproteobacteria bacterium]|nr:NDP-hexose 2,3-dehydratase family protein [Gammaproteobacteria bacterium]
MFHETDENAVRFLKSFLTEESPLNSVEEILEWVKKLTAKSSTEIQIVPLKKLRNWYFDDDYGYLHHKSGKFFSIESVRVHTNFSLRNSWDQPIINQPEIGYLGILAREFNGILHFLLQAKIEPGNINTVQLSPTLQATRSNYTRIHKGKPPLYLDYFNGNKQTKVLIDQLQSEQGARFLQKRNRNIIVEIGADNFKVHDNFIWVTLGQIKRLMCVDNLVNMNTRSVIASIPYGSYSTVDAMVNESFSLLSSMSREKLYSLFNKDYSYFSFNQIISWITHLKFKYELTVNKIPFKNIQDWEYDGERIYHKEKKYFSVVGVDAEIVGREVSHWDQPMICPSQEGILGYIIKNINGVYHFLVQAKVEVGNFDTLELAPTVQCLTGNYRAGLNEYMVPFLSEFFSVQERNIWHKSIQSEEGGRFFHEQNINLIIEVDDRFAIDVPENYCWITLDQLLIFMKFNNYLNIGSRSLISLISF